MEIKHEYDKKNSNKKSISIHIPYSTLLKIFIGLLSIVFVLGALVYFNSGLSHKLAKQEYTKYWEKNYEAKLQNIEIMGIKKIKPDSYWVKIKSSFYQKIYIDANGERRFISGHIREDIEKEMKERELGWEYRLYEEDEDYIFTKWDTGWFIEGKKR